VDSETLNQQLRISETARDPDLRADLEVVLSVHFPKGVSAGDVVQYRTEADEVALVVTHDENGHIKDLRSGPALREDDLEALQRRIDRDLLGDTASAVRREILFSDLPVTGSFRYRDRFEITPPPSGAPTPEYVLADHPFTLEVAHRSSADARLRMQRGIRETYATGLLLSGLVPWIGWMRPGYVEQRWPFGSDRSRATYARSGCS
jgi:hypothetical protein